jgi:hypothetical protein
MRGGSDESEAMMSVISARIIHGGEAEIDLRGVGWTAEFARDASGDDRYVTLVVRTHVLGAPHILGEEVRLRMSRSGATVLAVAAGSLPPVEREWSLLHGAVSEEQDVAMAADLLLDSLNEDAP